MELQVRCDLIITKEHGEYNVGLWHGGSIIEETIVHTDNELTEFLKHYLHLGGEQIDQAFESIEYLDDL